MKKRTLQITACLLAMTLLTGCGAQAAPADPTTISQATLLEKSAQPQDSYTFPEKFTGDWKGQEGRLTIHADAKVEAPQGVILPTATVEPRDFTQADVDNLVRVLLKGQTLYAHTQTKQELQDWADKIRSPQWTPDPGKGLTTPEQIEQERQRILAYYDAMLATAPEETPVVNGFIDDLPGTSRISGWAMVDGKKYEVSVDNSTDAKSSDRVEIIRQAYKYSGSNGNPEYWGDIPKDEAIAQGDALIQELGLTHMVLDDAQLTDSGTWQLYYVPTVNGLRLPSIQERVENHIEGYTETMYWSYSCWAEENPDTVYWPMECIYLDVGKEGVLSFSWFDPATEPVVKQPQTSLLPFEEIAAIADAMLPVVVIGPHESRSLVEIDQINGETSYVDVNITKVSLSLMRIRDKGSLHGTIVPVWDFWGSRDWYGFEGPYGQKGSQITTQPMLTLNAIDGSVVSRMFGY